MTHDLTSFIAGSSGGQALIGVVNPGDTPADGQLAVVALDSARKLQIAGSFSATVTPPTATTATAPTQTTVGTAAVIILAANANRIRFSLQNTGISIIKMVKGTGTITQANYHRELGPGGAGANDGYGAFYEDTIWKGEVQVISSVAGGLVNALEETA